MVGSPLTFENVMAGSPLTFENVMAGCPADNRKCSGWDMIWRGNSDDGEWCMEPSAGTRHPRAAVSARSDDINMVPGTSKCLFPTAAVDSELPRTILTRYVGETAAEVDQTRTGRGPHGEKKTKRRTRIGRGRGRFPHSQCLPAALSAAPRRGEAKATPGDGVRDPPRVGC
eukprot:gene13727-biopygen2021